MVEKLQALLNTLINLIVANPSWSKIIYGAVSIIFVIYYSIFAIQIFIDKPEILRKRNQSHSWRLHQIWVNALGQGIGWFVGYYVIRKIFLCGIEAFETVDYVRSIIAFAGVTGYLPTILSRWQPRA